MANTLKVTELDFDTIKSNMKEYFSRQDSPFRDWDFEGSGLNYLLDVLAYNTHYNAVNAHLSMNESFLDSAQIRSNVVSRAKLLGYIPRSRRGARAKIDISFSRKSGNDGVNTLSLPQGSLFSTEIDGITYLFSTRNNYQTIYNETTSLFEFKDVDIIQGEPKTEQFVVDNSIENQMYKIEDKNIDTSSIKVTVYSHLESSETQTYLNADNFSTYDENSYVYFLSENYEGIYQISFGNGLIGHAPENTNIVEIEYLSSGGSLVNDAKLFTYIRPGELTSFENIAEYKSLSVIESAYGGDERESIEAIRKVAPHSFVAQNRAVTTNDYETLIKKNIPDIDAVSVWGGQDNDPPIYGKVFLAAKPKGKLFLSDAQKDEIYNFLNDVSILTLFPEIVDTNYIYLTFDVFFNYDSNLTSLTKSQLENEVKDTITEFNNLGLGGFDNVFRYSKFLQAIDDTNPAILNSFARIYMSKNLSLNSSSNSSYEFSFHSGMYGQITQKQSYISSTSWRYNNQDLYFGDEPIENSSNKRNIYIYTFSSGAIKIKLINNAGELNVDTGKIVLTNIPSTIDTSISIKAIPNTYDIPTIRNQLITINEDETNIIGSDDKIYNAIARFQNI